PPRTAERTLQSYITRLRKALGAGVVVRVGQAYRLDLDESAIDVGRFRRAVASGDTAAALDEWSGHPLAGLDVPGLAAIVDGLSEQWLAVVEQDLARRVDGEPAAVV